jgi:excisionase family DNA binding protein
VGKEDRPRTIREAGEELGLSKHTIYGWIAKRRIGCVRLGRAVRIPKQEIERILAQGAAPALGFEERD